jgi:hypothetical protein
MKIVAVFNPIQRRQWQTEEKEEEDDEEERPEQRQFGNLLPPLYYNILVGESWKKICPRHGITYWELEEGAGRKAKLNCE